MVIAKENDTAKVGGKAVDSTKLFDDFIQAQTCIQVFSTFHELCTAIRLDYPPPHCSTAQTSFYPRLKAALSSHWKAKSLFDKLDKRFLSKEYFADQRSHKAGGFRAAQDLKVLIIGAGPCGLRTAIEMACLGAKTVVLEKRDNFSRNNVLHLWPYIITDLKTLGAKKIYGQFCSGAIDHISIRQLQLILLKLTLLLGVEIIVNVSFEGLCPPTSSQVFADGENPKGWTARVIPDNHSISNYEFDVVVGADGKRNTLQGFTRKEFRGKLAIGLTVNFINRRTTAEAKVEEISGVAYIFNQHFFKDLQSSTGIDLENIVYYKGDTHYFVMTAKKHSLISKGVLKQDSENTNELLCYSNIDQKALMQYAREAADFSTNHQLPDLEFAINQFAQPDIALFDFTCMYAAENAALFREVNGQKLLSCLVGDSLLEPFWPMGTGCARGFFAAFDLVWMTRQLAMKRRNSSYDPQDNSVELSVLAERESIYRVLHQTTPSNTMKKHQNYTIDPNTRYVNLNLKAVHVDQVRTLYLTDREVATPTEPDDATPMVVDQPEPSTDVQRKPLPRNVSMIRPILSWCQSTTKGYMGVDVQDLTSSWKSGLALCALVHRFRPDLIQWAELDYMDVEANNQLAFDVAEQNLGISPVMTGKEMANCSEVDRLVMLTYISQFYEVFKNETPSKLGPDDKGEEGETPTSPGGVNSPIGIINRFTSRFKRSLHHTTEEPDKKKKFNKPFSKKKSETSHKITGQKENKENKQSTVDTKQSGKRPDVIAVGDKNVQLRPKAPATQDTSAKVTQGKSNRVSALSDQLIFNLQKNASPKPSSDRCYFCKQRVYIVERLSFEGFFFHRHCFVCSHCGTTLRRSGYEFDSESGKFFCSAHYLAHSGAFKQTKHRQTAATEMKKGESEDKLTPLRSEGVKLRKPVQTGSYRTPERIELENMRHSMLNEPQEVSEEALNQHNLSGIYNPNNASTGEDAEYMSDSSDEDIDWEAVLKDAMHDHNPSESEIDSDDERAYESSCRGLHEITTFSILDDTGHSDGNCDATMDDITDQSEDDEQEGFARDNLSPVAEDNENPIREEAANSPEGAENEISFKSFPEKNSSSSESPSNSENSMATVDFGSEEEDVKMQMMSCSLNLPNGNTSQIRTLPRSCRDSKLNLTSDNSFEDLFQSVEVESGKRDDDEAPEECLFLSIPEMKLERQKFNLELTPQKCRVNYLPKKELSTISGHASDTTHDSEAAANGPAYDAVHVWLTGCLKLDSASESEQKPTNGWKSLELDTSDFSHELSSEDEKEKPVQSLSTSSSLDDHANDLVSKQPLAEKQDNKCAVVNGENRPQNHKAEPINEQTALEEGPKNASLSSISTASSDEVSDLPPKTFHVEDASHTTNLEHKPSVQLPEQTPEQQSVEPSVQPSAQQSIPPPESLKQSPSQPSVQTPVQPSIQPSRQPLDQPSVEPVQPSVEPSIQPAQPSVPSIETEPRHITAAIDPTPGVENDVAKPNIKPRTVFSLLSSPVNEEKVFQSSENSVAKNSEISDLKEAINADENNDVKHLSRFDTMDRVQNYLNETPIGIIDAITEKNPAQTSDLDENVSHSDDEELSSNSSSSESELNTAQLDVSDLIPDNSDKKSSSPPFASLLKSSEDRKGSTRAEKTSRHPTNITIRASITGRGDNTSVWSNLEDESTASELDSRPKARPRSSAFCDSSFISNYRPGPDSIVSGDETKPTHNPVQRQSSFDSLELRMKVRLKARNNWFKQDPSTPTRESKEHSSPSQPSMADSGISLQEKDLAPLSSHEDEEEPPSYSTTVKVPVSVEVTHPSPSSNTPMRSHSFDSEGEQFFTPPTATRRTLNRSGVADPISPLSSHSKPPHGGQRSFLDVTDDFVSAPTSPSNPRVLPNPPSSTRRALPALPKVAHLEALSPTGSPQSPKQKRKSIDEEMRLREIRVNERVAKMKEASLRNRSGSDITKTSCSSIDEADLISMMREYHELDVTENSGISPKQKRKSSFRHKLRRLNKKKTDSNSEDSENIRRSLPVPNLSGDAGSSSAFDSASKSESPGKKKRTKLRKGKTNLELTDAYGNENTESKKPSPGKTTRNLFRISPRKKDKKPSPHVHDGKSTLDRKYQSPSASEDIFEIPKPLYSIERERAIIRGERFRVLPQLPQTARETGKLKDIRSFSCDDIDEDQGSKRYQLSKHRQSTLAGLTAAQIDAKITRRVKIAARRQAKMEEQRRLTRAQAIQRQLEEVEVQQKALEERGVKLEMLLREKSGGNEKEESRNLKKWIELVQEKNALQRYENGLLINQRELQLEDVQSRLQQELRERMATDDTRKTSQQLSQEREILRKMLEVVEQRDELVGLLDEQRLKEREETIDPETLMMNDKRWTFTGDVSSASSAQT